MQVLGLGSYLGYEAELLVKSLLLEVNQDYNWRFQAAAAVETSGILQLEYRPGLHASLIGAGVKAYQITLGSNTVLSIKTIYNYWVPSPDQGQMGW